MSAIRDYLNEIQNEFNTGIAGEHAYRPALKKLLESFDAGLNAVNDPARTEIGMPDFVVLRQSGNVPIGIVEAKDIGNQLNRTEKTQQLKRYMKQGNLILTNYLEFRWYVAGEWRETVRIAKVANDRIVRIQTNYSKLADMLRRFAQQSIQSVKSAQALAERLADSAQLIAHFIWKDLKSDNPTANLANQMQAFQKTLLPGLDETKFSDMFAQTLVYGLFAARMNHAGNPAQFSLGGAAQEIPQTNPFLRRLFYYNSFDLGRRLTWLVEGVVEILRHADIDSILAHFGQRTGQTDPVVHFYETFLSAYNPTLRETRGVYYTPEPVVKYIVRSVDHILKTRFNRPDGLADKDTLILDPAAGTGTFLYYVIELIKERFVGQRGLWKDYVEERLLPRIFGFELLMAPYTIAHMNLGLQLKEAGYEFKEDERLGIYMTNALEEAVEAPPLPFANFIAEEANTAAEIKRDKPIMVVLGNPPYSGHSANRSRKVVEVTAPQKPSGVGTATRAEAGYSASSPSAKSSATVKRVVKTFIGELLEDYKKVDGKPLGEKNPKWLQDDYVKFIRFGQWRIEQTGEGILAFITNHGYLDNPTFRGMRESLLEAFTDIYIVNLHGNSIRREVTPEGNTDENVFDIRPGVAISIFVKDSRISKCVTNVHYLDIWGSRIRKYSTLDNSNLATIDWQVIPVSHPHYLFVPLNVDTFNEYENVPSIKDAMPANSLGIATARDALTIHFSSDSLWNTVTNFAAKDSETARESYGLGQDVRDWKVHLAQADLREGGLNEKNVRLIAYRPFDYRYTYYTGRTRGFICMPRRQIMRNFHSGRESGNLALAAIRRSRTNFMGNFWVTDCITDKSVVTSSDNCHVFPLYLYPKPGQYDDTGDDPSEFPLSEQGRRPNLSKTFVADMESKLGLTFQTEGSAFTNGDSPDWFGPEDVFNYAYAIFHSPTYRERYSEFLKIDFPRLPLTSNLRLFGALVKLGAELVGLHLMKSSKLNEYMTTFDKEGDDEVARGYPKYRPKGGLVHINKTQYFGGVSQEIWDFHIGGYQVMRKWLKDRSGRKLSLDDKEHYQKIVVALSETIRIMTEIDAAIPQFPLE